MHKARVFINTKSTLQSYKILCIVTIVKYKLDAKI